MKTKQRYSHGKKEKYSKTINKYESVISVELKILIPRFDIGGKK